MSDNLIAKTATADPGGWGGFLLQRQQRKAVVAIRNAELKVIRREATALITAVAEMKGTQLRADTARENATALAAITGEMTRTHTAIILEETASRVAGSFANIGAMIEAESEIAQLSKSSALPNEYVEGLIATVRDAHAGAEARIDHAHEAAKETTDRNFDLGSAASSSIRRDS